jgi:hypothetical protein
MSPLQAPRPYTKFKCLVNIWRAQQEFASDIVAQPPTLAMTPTSSVTSNLLVNSQAQAIAQVATQYLASGSSAQTESENPETHTVEVDIRPIWIGRPEVIYQTYLAEKDDYLAASPAVQSAQYRKKLGLTIRSKGWCLQQKKFLLQKRLNIDIEALVRGDPNWSIEELSAWQDWDKKNEEAIE